MAETSDTNTADENQTENTDTTKEGGNERTFSQADVDRIVQERVARVKATPPADYEEMKKAAAKLAEIEDANATELEKANKRAEKAEADALKTAEKAKETAIRAAIIAEAAKKNVVNPNVVAALVDRASIEFDGDGNPTNIAEAVEVLLEAEPYLAGGGTHQSVDQGARGGGADQLTVAQLKTMSPEEVRKAEAEGRCANIAQGL
jgi:hypothetical protein